MTDPKDKKIYEVLLNLVHDGMLKVFREFYSDVKNKNNDMAVNEKLIQYHYFSSHFKLFELLQDKELKPTEFGTTFYNRIKERQFVDYAKKLEVECKRRNEKRES